MRLAELQPESMKTKFALSRRFMEREVLESLGQLSCDVTRVIQNLFS